MIHNSQAPRQDTKISQLNFSMGKADSRSTDLTPSTLTVVSLTSMRTFIPIAGVVNRLAEQAGLKIRQHDTKYPRFRGTAFFNRKKVKNFLPRDCTHY